MLRWTGKKVLGLILLLSLTSGCSEFALLSSGSGLAISHNSYAKAYNGFDLATTLTTKKDIKTHAYHYVKKAKELKKLVLKTIAHDFDGISPDVVITHKVYMWELYQPDAGFFKVKNMENYKSKKQKYIMAYGGQI
jgi:hypothetical protein